MNRSAVMLAFSLAAMLLAHDATADTPMPCGAPLESWVARCTTRSGLSMTADHCADGVAVVNVAVTGETSGVELRRERNEQSFRRVGHIGISPVGLSTSWSSAPTSVRLGFEAIVRCVAQEAPTLDASIVGSPDAETAPRPAQSDAPSGVHLARRLRTVFALAAIAGWIALMFASVRRAGRRADVAAVLGAMAAAAVFRRVAIAAAFFHQNGHGAEWVEHALCERSRYGPGFAALFHDAASLAGVHAERGVFIAQELLATLAVGAVYVLARGLAVSRTTSFAVAAIVGLEPLLGRLARSESYYAATLWMLLLAIAALSANDPRARVTDPRSVAGAVIAGALLSIAVWIHPVAWVPAALAPSVVCMRRGARRRRVASITVSAGIVGSIVLAAGLPAVLAVMRGSLGAQWGGAASQGSRTVWIALWLALPWAVAVITPARFVRWSVPVAIMVAAARADAHTNLFGPHSTIAPAEAWRMLFRAVSLAGALGLVARLESHAARRTRRASIALAAIVLVLGTIRIASVWRHETALPTDAQETAAFASLLQSLPPDARVHYLASAARHVQRLPLYQRCGPPSAIPFPLSPQDRSRSVLAGDYWFRTSLCSTAAGRPVCDAIERTLVLRPIRVERFDARPSLPYLPYDARMVVSGLYHVEARREHP